jgi:VanZ family protein
MAVVAWLVLQLTLTSVPGDMLPSVETAFRIDWVAHFCLYFGLAVLVVRVFRSAGWPMRLLLVAWAAIMALGVLDELHQLLIPTRDAEVGDWVMDAMGSGCGLLIGTFLARTRWAARLIR